MSVSLSRQIFAFAFRQICTVQQKRARSGARSCDAQASRSVSVQSERGLPRRHDWNVAGTNERQARTRPLRPTLTHVHFELQSTLIGLCTVRARLNLWPIGGFVYRRDHWSGFVLTEGRNGSFFNYSATLKGENSPTHKLVKKIKNYNLKNRKKIRGKRPEKMEIQVTSLCQAALSRTNFSMSARHHGPAYRVAWAWSGRVGQSAGDADSCPVFTLLFRLCPPSHHKKHVHALCFVQRLFPSAHSTSRFWGKTRADLIIC